MPIEDMYHKRPGIEVSTFKSLRIAGEDFSYFYIRWCTNEVELYNTIVGLLHILTIIVTSRN